jgi:hypothetical protein
MSLKSTDERVFHYYIPPTKGNLKSRFPNDWNWWDFRNIREFPSDIKESAVPFWRKCVIFPFSTNTRFDNCTFHLIKCKCHLTEIVFPRTVISKSIYTGYCSICVACLYQRKRLLAIEKQRKAELLKLVKEKVKIELLKLEKEKNEQEVKYELFKLEKEENEQVKYELFNLDTEESTQKVKNELLKENNSKKIKETFDKQFSFRVHNKNKKFQIPFRKRHTLFRYFDMRN